jgi:hypothetical protein
MPTFIYASSIITPRVCLFAGAIHHSTFPGPAQPAAIATTATGGLIPYSANFACSSRQHHDIFPIATTDRLAGSAANGKQFPGPED